MCVRTVLRTGNTPTKLCKDIYLQDMLIAARPPELKEKINRDFRDQKKTGAKKDGYRNKVCVGFDVIALLYHSFMSKESNINVSCVTIVPATGGRVDWCCCP